MADVLRVPPVNPFQRELIAVHARGMARWVGQQLAQRLGAPEGSNAGLCANVTFTFPARVVAAAVEAAGGAAAGGGVDLHVVAGRLSPAARPRILWRVDPNG